MKKIDFKGFFAKFKKIRLSFSSPLTLIFCAVCAGATLLGTLTGGWTTRTLFSVYRASWANPLTWLRLFTHVFGHAGWSHLINNLMFILLLGPGLEEKYGWKKMLLVMGAAALLTGLAQMLLSPGRQLLGASGIVFAFILLSSFSVRKDGALPLTFLLVAVLYLGQQIVEGFTLDDNVSQFTHILGGLSGVGMGWLFHRQKKTIEAPAEAGSGGGGE